MSSLLSHSEGLTQTGSHNKLMIPSTAANVQQNSWKMKKVAATAPIKVQTVTTEVLRELNWSKLQIPPQQCERLIKSHRKQLFQVCAAKEFLQATESRGRLWFSPAASAVCLEQMLNLLRTRCLFIWPIKLIKDLCGLFLWLIMLNYCF